MIGKDRRSEKGKYIGTRFGKLVAIDYEYEPNAAKYLCKCDCGNEKWIRATGLTCGRVKSCGCYANSLLSTRAKLPEYGRYGPSIHATWRYYTRGAYKRGLEWQLTITQFITLCGNNCYYCGAAPSISTRTKVKGSGNGPNAPPPFVHNGIDRIDPGGGYTVDNVVSCCARCNWMKGGMSVSEFRQQVALIYNMTNTNLENHTKCIECGKPTGQNPKRSGRTPDGRPVVTHPQCNKPVVNNSNTIVREN